MELNGFYQNLPNCLKQNLKKLEEIFNDNVQINKKVNKIVNIQSVQFEVAFAYVIMEMIDVKEVLKKELFYAVSCYDEVGNEITLKKIIAKHKDAVICEGFYEALDKEVVVKYHSSKKIDITYEMECYRKLEEKGANVPWFYTRARCLGHPVLIMEKLEPLGKTDDFYKMASSILKTLKVLHKFAIHNDIKPANIMKNGDNYYLIDYQGSTSQRYKHGFIRRVWTNSYTSQEMHIHRQITTAKNDFIELLYTVKSLENKKNGKQKETCKDNFTGKLFYIKNYIDEIDEKYIPEEVYDTLIEMFESEII